MPDHTLSSSISSTKIFPEFLLPIEEFTLHQRRKLEGALQLHFTHSDHAEGVCLLQCSEVFFSFPYCIPNHSFLFRRKNQSSLTFFFLSILQSHPSDAVVFSQVWFLLNQVGQKRFFRGCNTFQCEEWKHDPKKFKDWELKWRKAPLFWNFCYQ